MCCPDHIRTDRSSVHAGRVHLRLSLGEAVLLYALAYLAHAPGTRVIGMLTPPDPDADKVLHMATAKLYGGLRAALVRGGL